MAIFPLSTTVAQAFQHIFTYIANFLPQAKATHRRNQTKDSLNAIFYYARPHMIARGRLPYSPSHLQQPSTPASQVNQTQQRPLKTTNLSNNIDSTDSTETGDSGPADDHTDLFSPSTAATREAESEWSRQAIEAVAERTRRILAGDAHELADREGAESAEGDDSLGSWQWAEETGVWGGDGGADERGDDEENGSTALLVVSGESGGFEGARGGRRGGGGDKEGMELRMQDGGCEGWQDPDSDVGEAVEDYAGEGGGSSAWRSSGPEVHGMTESVQWEQEGATVWSDTIEGTSESESEPERPSTIDESEQQKRQNEWHSLQLLRQGSVLEKGVHIGRRNGCSIL